MLRSRRLLACPDSDHFCRHRRIFPVGVCYLCQGHILWSLWLNSAALFYTRVWVELVRTVTRQTLCTQHHNQTWRATSANHDKI